MICQSCEFKFSPGRGLCADWFCSERCRDWYDAGNGKIDNKPKFKETPTHTDNRKPSIGITLEQLVIAIDLPNKAIKKDYLLGKYGKIVVREDGRNFYLVLDVSRRQISALKTKLSFMYEEDGKFFLYRLPTGKEAGLIREAIGIKKRPVISSEIRQSLKNNLPTPLETPSSWEKTA